MATSRLTFGRSVGLPLDRSAVGSGPAAPGPGQQGVDLGPERPPGAALGLGELRQGVRIADAGQVGVGPPVLERLLDQRAGLGIARIQHLRPGGPLGLQPVEGLAAEPGPGGVIGLRVVRPLAGGRPGPRRRRRCSGARPGGRRRASGRPPAPRPRTGRRRRSASCRSTSGRWPGARRRPSGGPRP